MKRPYLHNQSKDSLKPFFVYAARCLDDIKSILANKEVIYHTKLKEDVFLVWFKE